MKKSLIIGSATLTSCVVLGAVVIPVAIKVDSNKDYSNNDNNVNNNNNNLSNIYKLKKYGLPSTDDAINSNGSILDNEKNKEAVIEYLDLQHKEVLKSNNINSTINKAISEKNTNVFKWVIEWGKANEEQKKAIAKVFWDLNYNEFQNQYPAFSDIKLFEIKYEINLLSNSIKEFVIKPKEFSILKNFNNIFTISLTEEEKNFGSYDVRFNRNDSITTGTIVKAGQNLSFPLQQANPEISFQSLGLNEGLSKNPNVTNDVWPGTLESIATKYITKDFLLKYKKDFFTYSEYFDKSSYIDSIEFSYDDWKSEVHAIINWTNLNEKSTIKIKVSDDARIHNAFLDQFYNKEANGTDWTLNNTIETAYKVSDVNTTNGLINGVIDYIFDKQNTKFGNIGNEAKPISTPSGFIANINIDSKSSNPDNQLFKRWIKWEYKVWLQTIKSLSQDSKTPLIMNIDHINNIQFEFEVTKLEEFSGATKVKVEPKNLKIKFNSSTNSEIIWQYSKDLKANSSFIIYLKK